MTRTLPTEQEICDALCRDRFYGQQPEKVVVPTGYVGSATVNGIPVQIAEVDEAYVVPAEGGRLALDGREL